MEVRNLAYNSDGTINMEVNHPDYGWIPFTASPDDVEGHGKLIYAEAISGALGTISPYVG